ncbi:MAG: hypothetical protein IIY20_01030 [Bifidobacteriaceae bacterium]|nr:hypothetical protein [Bifidobacteriaceae bacterium]
MQNSTAAEQDSKPRKTVREVFIDSSSVFSFAASIFRAVVVPVSVPYLLLLVSVAALRLWIGNSADAVFRFFALLVCIAAVSFSAHETAHAACLASREYAHDLSVRVYFMKICVVARREHSAKRLIIAALAGPFAGAISALILGFAFNMLPIACFIAFFNLFALIPPADDGMRILEASKTAKTEKTV